jgi:ribonuclease P/MRP protein subunit RPP40
MDLFIRDLVYPTFWNTKTKFYPTLSIYLDFSKAFDKVDIGILAYEMKDLGICGTLGKYIHTFFFYRRRFVIVDGTISKVSQVKSGVPQGTVLGPILFLLLINDIDKLVL